VEGLVSRLPYPVIVPPMSKVTGAALLLRGMARVRTSVTGKASDATRRQRRERGEWLVIETSRARERAIGRMIGTLEVAINGILHTVEVHLGRVAAFTPPVARAAHGAAPSRSGLSIHGSGGGSGPGVPFDPPAAEDFL
jgi:hypothetical protein